MRALARLRHFLRTLLSRQQRRARARRRAAPAPGAREPSSGCATPAAPRRRAAAPPSASAASRASRRRCRESWGIRFLETLAQDLKYGARSLRRNPGFTGVVALTLGLGIGANTAVFSVVRGVLLRPLPYARGQEVVALHQPAPQSNIEDIGFSVKEVKDYAALTPSLEDVVEYHSMNFTLLGGAGAAARPHGRRLRRLLRRAGRRAAARPDVPRGRGRHGRGGAAGAEPRLLAAAAGRRSRASSAATSR